jgi:hypothetical protein
MTRLREGICCLCGQAGQLSFEHVPPRAAFNNSLAIRCRGDEWLRDKGAMPWDVRGRHYQQQQSGTGEHSLCPKCNNDTGAWYAKDYAHFAECVVQSLGTADSDHIAGGRMLRVSFRDIYPLRIVKEIVAMFATVNGPAFHVAEPDLCALVLGRGRRGIDPERYRLGVYALSGTIRRWTGMSSLLYAGSNGSNDVRVVSELSAVPCGFVLECRPHGPEPRFLDITGFANQFTYDDTASFDAPVPVFENNTMLPLDYRTKGEIISDTGATLA